MSGKQSLQLCFFGWGDHVHLERWAGYFARAGHQVSVISVSGFGNYPEGVRQYSLSRIARYSFRLRQYYIRYLLWRINPDILHVHWAGFLVDIADAWQGKLIVTAWGSDIYKLGDTQKKTQENIIQGLKKASLVTCDSSDLATEILHLTGISERCLSVIQWGVDTTAFSARPKPTRLMKELGIDSRTVILSPRSFTPLYNLDKILLAFQKVKKVLPDVALVMKRYNADVDYEKSLHELISRLEIKDSVFICDRVEYSEMADFYSSGDVMVSVPKSDGTPMSMLEAMACGCGLIMSDLPSIREWVKDGWNGLLVPVDDEKELANALINFLKNKEVALDFAQKNLDIVHKKASQLANMKKMESKYQDIQLDHIT